MAGPDKPQRGDETELFELYHRQLLHRVRRAVCASPEVIEDACAFAWMEFLRFQPDRNRGWRSWLFVTAKREAWRLDRERCQVLTIDESDRDVARPWTVGEPADTRDYQQDGLDFMAAMELLEELPPRPRQIAFLRAIGAPYADIMEITGLSQSHVSRTWSAIAEVWTAVAVVPAARPVRASARRSRECRKQAEAEARVPAVLADGCERSPGGSPSAQKVVGS